MWETVMVFIIVSVVAFLFVRSLYRKSIESGQGRCGKGCGNPSCPYSGTFDPTKEQKDPAQKNALKKD